MEIRKEAPQPRWPPTPKSRIHIFHLLFSIFAVAFLIGCGVPGEPVERKPPIPTAVTDLAATQQGDNVIVTFTFPKDSVEGRELKQPPAIEIFRVFQPVPASSAPTSVPANPTLLVTIPSAMVDQFDVRRQIRYDDALKPEDFTQHPNTQAVYIVRTRTSPKKVSADSNAATLRVEPAPEQITDLKAEVTHRGIILTWTPPQKTAVGPAPPIALYRIFRNDIPQGTAPAAAPPSRVQNPALPIG